MINQKSYFYILSYPRCRSTWFSSFFSTNVCYCFHELLSNNNPRAFQQMKDFPRPYVGSADTNPVSFMSTLKEPGALVIIERPEKDVINALHKAFDKHPDFTQIEWTGLVNNIVYMAGVILDYYKKTEKGALVVPFKDLEDDQVLMRIFKHCVPQYDPDWAYIRHFNNLKISLKARDNMAGAVDTTMRYRNKTLKQYKKDNITGFDRAAFYDAVWNRPEKMEKEAPKIAIASR